MCARNSNRFQIKSGSAALAAWNSAEHAGRNQIALPGIRIYHLCPGSFLALVSSGFWNRSPIACFITWP